MRPHGKARVNPSNPEAFAKCDRCGLLYNHVDLSWQFEWGGVKLYNKEILVCNRCLDEPQEQLRTIILPPDPPPIFNARVEDYAYAEQTVRLIQFASPLQNPSQYPYGPLGPPTIRATQGGEQARVLQFLTSS